MIMQMHTLAQQGSSPIDPYTLIVYAIGILVFILPAITNALKGKQQPKPDEDMDDDQPAASRGGLTLDEIATRRRAQMQDHAQGQPRRGQTSARIPGASGGGASRVAGGAGEPGNLTMAERIARARAKQQYEQRARTLTQPPAPPPPPAKAPPGTPRRTTTPGRVATPSGQGSRAQVDAARRELEQRRRQAAQQRAAAAQRQREAQARARAQARAQQAPSRQAPPRPGTPPARPTPSASVPPLRTAPPIPPVSPVAPGHGINAPEHTQVHRRVEDASPRVVAKRGTAAGLNFAKLSKADLRRAFILKEMLDQPLAVRDPRLDRHPI